MRITPRRAALVGIIFIVIAAIYYGVAALLDPSHVDWAGFTMLIALGAAMALMAYVLFSGFERG